jgi:hypothetical protein
MIMTDQKGNATKSFVYWIQISKEINISAYTTCGFRNMEVLNPRVVTQKWVPFLSRVVLHGPL